MPDDLPHRYRKERNHSPKMHQNRGVTHPFRAQKTQFCAIVIWHDVVGKTREQHMWRAGGEQALRRTTMGKTWEKENHHPSSWRLPGQHTLLHAGSGRDKPRERSSLMPVQRELLGAPVATVNVWDRLEHKTGAPVSLALGQARPRPHTIQEGRHLEPQSGPGQENRPCLASCRQT
jgi:hypothetical protein